MLKMTVLALLALAVTALPGFAAETAPGMQASGMPPDMNQNMMHQHPDMKHEMNPEMKQQMMQSPQHLLAMAYHKNLVNFAQALKKVAQQGDTVPRDFARSAVTEMRRSADQMEINHEEAVRGMPAELKAKHAEMAQKMAAHLATMRAELAQLDQLSKGDRVDSKELLKHLEALLQGCAGMPGAGGCGEARHRGMRGGMHGDCGPQQDRGEGCGGCGHQGRHEGCGGCGEQGRHGGYGPGGKMHGAGNQGCREMMQEREKMMQEMKAQDAQISQLVDKMNSAPNDLKQAVMADILTRMARQRAQMSAFMDKMQEHMKKHRIGQGGMSPCMMQGMEGDEENPEDADALEGYPDDSDTMDSDNNEMDMRGMHMQDK
jgi:hypothetical protein